MQLVVPSERNFEIFHAVEVDNLSRREAAARFGISSTRVQQIVEQVKHFVSTHGAENLVSTAPEQLELASLNLCYNRLDYFYKSTMRLWHKAQEQPQPASANVRLLHSAVRISIDQTKVVGRIAKVRLAMIEEGTLAPINRNELTIRYEEETEAAPEPTSPPTRGCTAKPAFDEADVFRRVLAASASPSADDSCDQLLAAMLRRKVTQTRETGPAQSGRRPRDSAA